MTTTLNATTSNGLVVTPDNSGNILLQYNGQSAPAFSAQMNSTSIPNVTWTKVTYGTENFDTNNNFASSRFTPTVAGYYQINANLRYANSIGGTVLQMAIYKNGAMYAYVSNGVSTGVTRALCVSTLLYCNGSTDYIEIYTYQNSGSTESTDSGDIYTFSGCLMRGA
jgi:hypothetical protein